MTVDMIYFLFQQTMVFLIPLMIVALGGLFSEKSGVVNIALEGKMIMGAFTGVLFISMVQEYIPGQPILILGLLVAMATGILVSFLHAYASINLKANQIISGVAINMFAPAFAVYVARLLTGTQNIRFTNQFRIERIGITDVANVPVLGQLFIRYSVINIVLSAIIMLVALALLIKYVLMWYENKNGSKNKESNLSVLTFEKMARARFVKIPIFIVLIMLSVVVWVLPSAIYVIERLLFQDTFITTYLGFIILAISSFVIYKTKFGLRLRACGEHPQAADSVGVSVAKMRYAGVLISGALAGIGGLVWVIPVTPVFTGSVSGYGFLALAVLIFGAWKPVRILFAAFFFGFMQTISHSYSAIPFLLNLGIPAHFYRMFPFIATLIVLAFTSKNTMAPKAVGQPYDKGGR